MISFSMLNFVISDRFTDLRLKIQLPALNLSLAKCYLPKKNNVSLLDNIYNILVEYYNTAYELEFLSIVESVQETARCPDHRFIVV